MKDRLPGISRGLVLAGGLAVAGCAGAQEADSAQAQSTDSQIVETIVGDPYKARDYKTIIGEVTGNPGGITCYSDKSPYYIPSGDKIIVVFGAEYFPSGNVKLSANVACVNNKEGAHNLERKDLEPGRTYEYLVWATNDEIASYPNPDRGTQVVPLRPSPPPIPPN